jgi:hypothetical protein
VPSPTRSRSASPDTPEQSQAPESSPTPGQGDAKAGDADAKPKDDDEPTPSWVWWLIGLGVVAIGALVIWLVSRSRKRNAWLAELKDAEADVDWFAHTLLPGLRQTGSLEQVVGGWQVGATRVGATEDQLTVLESSAPQEEDGVRARALRDAVRLARSRMEQLTTPGPHDSWALDLDDTIAGLDTALGPSEPATRA